MDLISFEDFELNPQSYRLRRSGQDLKLERIPLELLLLLANRPGELITREEIVEKLWGKGVHLDTENAINTAIRKIRLTLGDDPAQPRFVQTVTGKGYRFIARIADPAPSPLSTQEGPENFISGSVSLSNAVQFAGSQPRRGRRAVLLTGSAACLLVLGIVFMLMRWNASPPQASDYLQITNDSQPKIGPVLTDGLRLYFTEGSLNHRTLVQIAASGGETTALTNPLETPYLMDVAPNRSDLLIGLGEPSNSALWMLALPSRAVRRVGDVQAEDATWSPDGREIAYLKGKDLYRADKDGIRDRKLAAFSGIPSWVRWSPDGGRLRLTVTDSITGFSSLWEVRSDGKAPHPLLAGWSQAECCGSWTPDGKYFLFQATRDGKTEIWAVREKRGLALAPSQPVRLTAGQMNSSAPMVSPNGKKLYVIGEQLRGELVHYDSKSREFVPYLSGISAEFVDISRDGKWVTYVTFPDRILWRSRVDGSERLQLTASPVQATMPRWSPDGNQIAYHDTSPGTPGRIFLISSKGGKPEPLLNEPRNQMDPNWSPAGDSVVFSYFPLFDRVSPEKLGIYMVDLKTRGVKKLPGSGGLWVPRWSSDGSHIVARSADSKSLMLFDFATQIWSELVKDVYVSPVNWSADGRSVFYMRRGAQPAILRVEISDHKVEEIVSLMDLRQTGFRGAIWTGLTPDDSPMLLRNIGTQEIYALDLRTP
jgi:Tol biopolymer transport system component/DNA-binding winged helix-turn-helix (wHTH) protein